MAASISNRWTTHPEYIDFLNYVIERTKNAKSPMNIMPLAKEFKEKSGAAQTVYCLIQRIESLRKLIHSFEQIDTSTKVKMMFALGASVDASFLKELNKDALVKIDEKKRITHYKTNDGSLELTGDHSRRSEKNRTGKLESKGSLRSMITSYFETKDDADAIPKNKKEKEMGNLIAFISEKCVNVDKPINICQLAKGFKNRFGISAPLKTICTRVKGYCREIQKLEFLDTQTKIQQLFGLSATVDSDCLKELRKNALVEVDEKIRITYYKAADGSLELRGDHSKSAKCRTAQLESKGSIRSMINRYFEKKNDAGAVPNNESESEMWQLIEFITENCQTVDSPLSICQLTKDFIQHFGSTVLFETVRKRIIIYGREIQKMESLDTLTKVKQLFCLSASVDSDYLEKLRKDAFIEVDDMNRITKYTANNGRLTLYGDHSRYAKRTLSWIMRRRNKITVKKHSNSGGDEDEEIEKENGYSEDDSNEYSSEEFGSEFDSDDENDPLDKTEDLTQPSNEANHFDNETPIRNRSPTEISIDDNLDFAPPTERSHRSGEIEMGEDQENDPEIMGNTSVKTRYGRLSRRRHLDSEFSCDLASSRSSEAPASFESASSKPAKQKKIAIEKEQAPSSSNQSRSSSRSIRRFIRSSPSFSTESGESMENQDAPRAEDNPPDYCGPRVQNIEDYDYNPRKNNIPESSAFDNRLGEPELPSIDKQSAKIEAPNTHNISDEADFDNEAPVRNRSPTEVSIDDNFDFDLTTERTNRSEETELREDNRSDHHRPRIQGMEDYDQRADDIPERSSINIPPQESEPPAAEENNSNIDTENRSDSVAPEPNSEKECHSLQNNKNTTTQTNGEKVISPKIPVKAENEEPILAEDYPEDVKPEIAHNSKIKFFEAMQSLILFLDTPSLSDLKSKIYQKIRKSKRSNEVLQNNELIPAMELLIARMVNHSVINTSRNVESVSLIQFFCYLKASILNSKMIGLQGLTNNISRLIEKSQNKKIPMEKVANALRATLDVDNF